MTTETDRAAFEGIATATVLKPGDRLLVTVSEHMSPAQIESCVSLLSKRLPDVPFTILQGAQVAVLQPEPAEYGQHPWTPDSETATARCRVCGGRLNDHEHVAEVPS